jgi:hypothetical protein
MCYRRPTDIPAIHLAVYADCFWRVPRVFGRVSIRIYIYLCKEVATVMSHYNIFTSGLVIEEDGTDGKQPEIQVIAVRKCRGRALWPKRASIVTVGE